jgi:hypothetical protein
MAALSSSFSFSTRQSDDLNPIRDAIGDVRSVFDRKQASALGEHF